MPLAWILFDCEQVDKFLWAAFTNLNSAGCQRNQPKERAMASLVDGGDTDESHLNLRNVLSSRLYSIQKRGGKCTYRCHASTIYSVEQAIGILDYLSVQTDSEECLPFAIRIVENGELVVIAEDNGEFSIGELLADSLLAVDGYNTLICLSRKVRDCGIHDMCQQQKRIVIKKAVDEGIELLKNHLKSSKLVIHKDCSLSTPSMDLLSISMRPPPSHIGSPSGINAMKPNTPNSSKPNSPSIKERYRKQVEAQKLQNQIKKDKRQSLAVSCNQLVLSNNL